ncbi:cell division protein DedD, partial [Escherichia coli]
LDPSRVPVNNNSFDEVQEPVVAAKPQPKPQPKPVEKPQPQQVAQTPPPAKTQPQPQQQQAAIPAPTGKAYVVQLGALKNADKVNEIVGKLRSS